MTDDLDRLSAGLAEDERIARAAAERADEWRQFGSSVSGGPFTPADPKYLITESGTHTIVYDEGWPLESEAQHIARHDPAREVSEVALKRLILDRHDPEKMEDGTYYCGECRTSLGVSADGAEWPCDYIEALQAIYPKDTAEDGESST